LAQQFKKMVIEDLELEFESEEKSKGDGSIQPNVELVFAVEADAPTPTEAPAKGAGNVTPITQAKKSPTTQTPPTGSAPTSQTATPTAPAIGDPAQVQELKNQTMQAAQAAIDASLKQLQTTLQMQMQQMSQTLLLMQQKLQQVETKIAQGGGGAAAVNANPQVDYERKLAVSDYRGDVSGDFKLLEFKINQILLQVHAKNPNFQKEILNIKKMMQDFQLKFQKKE
jgi:hypothetical protein